ncbi:MAG: RNB domain-containing ribonuclease, partial [Elusimicrobia bacterium]|nr:RNB domain-containing ribonuclease [Elusimicrobiota bacterium]
LELLTRFTLDGPAPAARGDAYLYAQGAKALPPGLEEARRARAAEALTPAPGESLARTKLYRRGGRAYIMLEDPEAEGMSTTRPVKVPAHLAQGIVTDTLVEAVYQGKAIRALRPIGAYAADMVIGRVTRVGSELRLAALFSGDPAKALYAPLPLSAAASEGRILQAFVRPAQAGYEAVPLIDLGAELTPEVAAREIALRHGARGYFERAVIEQAEAVGRSQDPEADFRRMRESKGRAEDLRGLPFVTIDPAGAGDLDDAYFIRREADGSWTWYLATADVGAYVRPGTPAFRAAARVGNTFYSVDKDGVPEYPMNHPVVSKAVSSLLAGKDSLAMVTKMRFSAEGKFLLEDSEVFLGLVRVQGRYTYGQVADLWRGKPGHGIVHLDQVALARELSAKLDGQDSERGKLKLSFTELRHGKGPDGRWGTSVVEHDPLESESHRLIEELKVYGNRAIATRLEAVAEGAGAPHISRVHPAQDEKVDERLRKELSAVGAPWRSDETLWQYLARLKADGGLRAEVKETAQLLALVSRASALYAADDAEGHDGLALKAKAYDHPSTPIRRFSDMYNRALLEAYLEGGDPRAVHEAVMADLKTLGFSTFEEYLDHLNGREQAARRMDREFEAFMAVYELAKPENKGRRFTGYVKMLKEGRNAEAVIQLRELPVSITLSGEEARRFKLLGEVSVLVRSADPSSQSVDAVVTPAGGR